MRKEIRYDHADVSNRDFAMPVEVTTTEATGGEQQDGERYEPRGGIIYTQEEEREAERKAIESGLGIGEWRAFLPKKEPSVDRRASEPRGLARLDAAGVSAICEILADVIDDGANWDGEVKRPWLLYADQTTWDDCWREDTASSNADRLDFIAEVRRRIVQRAAPATTATGTSRAKGER